MSRILLVDDSPHAQRMGERILSEEGFEVVTVSNADSALIRLDDVDPDVVLADTVMPGRSGYEICQFVKMSPRHRHVRVILTAGVLEPLDEDQVKRVQADATVKKPFEASVLLATVKPLMERAVEDRSHVSPPLPGAKAFPPLPAAAPFVTVVDAELVRAAVVVAFDASMEKVVEEITSRVLAALQTHKSPVPAAASAGLAPELSAAPKTVPAPLPAPKPPLEPRKPAEPAALPPRMETVRRVNPLRSRPGSILGLDLSYGEPGTPAVAPRLPAADPDPGPRGTAYSPRPATNPDASALAPNPRPFADRDPGFRAAFGPRSAANPEPTAPPNAHSFDADPGSRSTVPGPRSNANLDPSAPPDTRPVAEPDPGPRPAGPDQK